MLLGGQSDDNGWGDFDSVVKNVVVEGNVFENIFLSANRKLNCSMEDFERDDAFGVLIWPNVEDVLILGNTMRNISGDGVQCAGVSGEENDDSNPAGHDPFNIEIRDNEFLVERPDGGVPDGGIDWRRASENAVDIKSCHGVTIAGNKGDGWIGKSSGFLVPPPGWAGDPSKLVDGKIPVSALKGGAFVVHYGGRDVRIEENRIKDTCGLVSLGRIEDQVFDDPDAGPHYTDDILIRSNLYVAPDSSPDGGEECQGDSAPIGVLMQNASDVDVNNNTFVLPGGSGTGMIIASRDSGGVRARARNIDLWNNIFEGGQYWVEFSPSTIDGLNSRDNHYTHPTLEARHRLKDKHSLGTNLDDEDVPLGRETFENLLPSAREWTSTVDTSTSFVDEIDYALACGVNPARNSAFQLDIGPRVWDGSNYTSTAQAPKHVGWNQTGQSGCMAVIGRPAQIIDICMFTNRWWPCILRFLLVSHYYAGGRLYAYGAGGLVLKQLPFEEDVDVRAEVTLDGSNLSGVVARVLDDDTYYGLRLHLNEGVELFRKVDGVHTTLGMTPVLISDATPYELRLRVRGRHPVTLEAWLDSTQKFNLTDTAAARLTEVGEAGLLSGSASETAFDDLVVEIPESLPVTAETLLHHDDFTSCLDDDEPDPTLWSVEGTYYCRSERLRGESAEELALLHGIDAFNAQMRARVRLNTDANKSGVVARAANGSYYVARLDVANEVRLERVDSSGATLLAGYSTTIDPDISYRLELRAVGWLPVQLDVYLEQDLLLSHSDDSPRRLMSGHVGLISGSTGRTQLDDVYVTAK